ncbi:MAG: MerR family transcriptional regulator [Marinisporobacter sp.]|jgi:DNA-binding transcriptional MerR regulator/predicted transcriptional regulator YdeE|nr:MerR family transcriptional regulator [Marinisporobacter sp.]
MNRKFLISEVAKRYNISRPTLIYYDNINLLKPSYNESNGYRCYTYEDMDKLELILTLKETGLSLKAIESFMSNPSHKGSIDLLSIQKRKIDKKIKELQKLQIALDRRISMISEYENVQLYKGIKFDYYPNITICKYDLNYNDPTPYETAARKLKNILDQSPTSYGSIISKYGLCLGKNQLFRQNFEHYKYIFNYLSHPINDGDTIEIPANYFVRCLHHGPYNTASETFKHLLNYITQNNYRIIGDAYIIPLIDLWATTSENDYVSEILIPVET